MTGETMEDEKVRGQCKVRNSNFEGCHVKVETLSRIESLDPQPTPGVCLELNKHGPALVDDSKGQQVWLHLNGDQALKLARFLIASVEGLNKKK